MTGVLFSPHNDDETLFAAFTVIRYQPEVVVCFKSARDYGDAGLRECETRAAVKVLGAPFGEQWDGGDLRMRMQLYDQYRPFPIPRVWAPSPDTSHPDHLTVARAARDVFGDRVTYYHTYRDGEKVRAARPVTFDPGWLELKLRALACYRSQIQHPRAHQFFAWDLLEYQVGR